MAQYRSPSEDARMDRADFTAGRDAGRQAHARHVPGLTRTAAKKPRNNQEANYRRGLRVGLKENVQGRQPVRQARSQFRGASRKAVSSSLGAATQVWHFLLLAVALVVFYLLLRSAGAVTGVFGGLQKAFAWIESPTATI